MKVNKKWLALLSLAFLVVIGLAGCGKKSDDSLQQIKDKKVLTMGTSADYAPFEFTIMKNGKKEYVGYDIMVAQKIADSLGVKLKVQNMEFSSIISELQDHKVDIALAGMNVTPQRKKVVDFSKPYYTEQESLLVKKADADKYNTIADTKGASFGVQQSSTQETIAKTQTKAKLVSESLVTGLATDLKSGKLDGVVLAKKVAEQYVAQYPDTYAIAKVRITAPASMKEISIAIPKDEPKLKAAVNKEITKLQKSGELDKLFKKAQEIQEQNTNK